MKEGRSLQPPQTLKGLENIQRAPPNYQVSLQSLIGQAKTKEAP